MRELRASYMAPDAPLVHAMPAVWEAREPKLAVLVDEANQYGQLVCSVPDGTHVMNEKRHHTK
jgi:hypothetical protein